MALKVGRIVQVVGFIAPVEEIASGSDLYNIATLPTEYRPMRQVTVRCQGAGVNTWMLNITTGGVLRFSRYGASSYIATPTSAQLCINITFISAS